MQAGGTRRHAWVGCVQVCVSVAEAEVRDGGRGVWVTGWTHTHTQWESFEPRSQLCGVIILNLRVHLLIIWLTGGGLFRSTLMQTPSKELQHSAP